MTLFSGYDSQCLALERLKSKYPQFDYELVAWCEIDTAAITAHNALFPQWKDRNIGDITQVDASKLPPCDLITWSSPCQDISAAGRMEGLTEGSGTRSSLAWEAIRIIKAIKPRYALMENVKNLVQRKFIRDFHSLQRQLEEIGYTNFTKVLNAKNFGIPQNRERVFMVSVLRTEDNQNPTYSFPRPFPLRTRLIDVLEDKVDEKYFLSDKMMEYFNRVSEDKTHNHNFKPQDGGGCAFTIRTAPGQRVDDNFVFDDEHTTESRI